MNNNKIMMKTDLFSRALRAPFGASGFSLAGDPFMPEVFWEKLKEKQRTTGIGEYAKKKKEPEIIALSISHLKVNSSRHTAVEFSAA